MTTLRLYRDDGPLADWVGSWLPARRRSDARAHPFAWLVPPFLRLFEYGSLIALAAVADPDALPMCFALLVVLALHHYDTAYRLRQQGTAPPTWVRLVGGGWEGRIIVACVLASAGALEPGYLVGAVALGLVYVGESASSWTRFSEAGREQVPEESGDVVE